MIPGNRQANPNACRRTAVFWVVGMGLFWGTPRSVLVGLGMGPTRVEVGEVKRQVLAPTALPVGRVRPSVWTVLASEVGGLVAEMHADDGKTATEGRVLCKLRDVRQRLVRAEARGRLREYEGSLVERAAELKKAEFEKARTGRLWAAIERVNREVPAGQGWSCIADSGRSCSEGWPYPRCFRCLLFRPCFR